MEFERLARAKVNLFLHVGPLRDDGFHPIASLMTFADVGDRVRIRSAREMGFSIEGEFADGLDAGPGNLVARARDAVLAAYDIETRPFHLTLEKNLPVAAGLGGGSADAAATLELLDLVFSLRLTKQERARFNTVALGLGSDVPACLRDQPVLAQGRGERMSWPPLFPDLDAVLVNPLAASPTGAVYAAYDEAAAPGAADAPAWPERFETVQAVADFLAGCRNDLEAPAVGLTPAIGETLGVLRAERQTLLARMSGSGATAFALCADARAAAKLAEYVALVYPLWWVRRARLQGFRP